MERRIKERLTGAAVLMMIAVIFIPMVLDNSNGGYTKIEGTNIPPQPDAITRSRIIPVGKSADLAPPVIEKAEPADNEKIISNQSVTSPSTITTESTAISPAAIQTPTPAPVPEPEPLSSISNNPPETANLDTEARGLTAWVVQLGSFSNQANAEGLVGRLQAGGYPAYIEKLADGSAVIFRVRVGPELSKAGAETTLSELNEKFAIKGMVLTYP